MNNFWKQEFGYGISELTNSEVRIIYRAVNVNEIRNRITQARILRGSFDGAGIPSKTRQNTSSFNGTYPSREVEQLKILQDCALKIYPKAEMRTEKVNGAFHGAIVFEDEKILLQQIREGSRFFKFIKKKTYPTSPN